MSRVPSVIVDPKDPMSVVEHLYRVQRVVDGKIEFGHPQDPNDPTSTTRADGVSHNGTILNIDGSWFFKLFVATGPQTVTCVHNLNVSTQVTALISPNVRWLLMGMAHDGTGGGPTAALSLDIWYQGGTRTADAIDLRFNLTAAGGLTVDTDHPVGVSLFFIRAVR